MNALRAVSPTSRAALIIVVLGLIPAAVLFRLGYLYWPIYLALATILALIGLIAGRAIWGISNHPKLRSQMQGLWMSGLTIVILLMGLEAFCRIFVAWSDGFVVTLSEQNWLRRHWQPLNSLGYRDEEWSQNQLAGRTKILVLGDSVTAGAGLENIHDRFQNVLESSLGDRYAVMTAAQIGWNSEQELAALKSYPYPPDVVILVYSVNDIDGVAAAHGVSPRPTFSLHNTPLFPLITTSYFLNFAYYSTLRLPVWGSDPAVRDYQRQAHADPAVWAEHTATLRAIDDWSRAHNARLVVMALPDINSPVSTSTYTRQVAEYFQGLGDVSVLDMGPELSKHDPRQMAISTLDAHPNAATQRLFAVRLCPLIAALPGLPPVSCPQSP